LSHGQTCFCKSLINMVFTKNDNQNYNLKKPQYRVGTGANRIPTLPAMESEREGW